ncbi:hypothetical protein MKW94_023355 [Papaver nudicaule]|uniref:Electron transfer flavoprotein-ubiquinone oxidoreductase n=1 Tax=Papaver nudicaule TaxID=74823 RepID=A0AA41V9A5_PAPNU|nr:hypothetical protein [Papaver nudicaule]
MPPPNSLTQFLFGGLRNYSTSEAPSNRESIDYDLVIVGAGPAGLSAAIRFKQMCVEKEVDLSVCVVEKGAEVGAHILSGNVFEPRALDELIPLWKQQQAPITVPMTSDKFLLLTKNMHFHFRRPSATKGITLSQLVRWMGSKAEELGVEIYPGFAASEILYDASGNDMGIAKDGSKKETFQRGRITLLAEGCRGSLSEVCSKIDYKLREKVQAQHQTYALGIKEVWEIDELKHKPGAVLHTLGWPLDNKTYGGSFLYHMQDRQVFKISLNFVIPGQDISLNIHMGDPIQYSFIALQLKPRVFVWHCLQVSLGLVVALDYKNPFLNPYEEFQKLKHHPAIRPLLEGGTVLQYGARTLNEGGFQAFEYGLVPGLAVSAVEHYILKGRSPMTLKHGKPDHEATEPANLHTPIVYPKPDGLVSFDVPTSLYTVYPTFHFHFLIIILFSFCLCRSNTNHEHDQTSHLHLEDKKIPELVNLHLTNVVVARAAEIYQMRWLHDVNMLFMMFLLNKLDIPWTVPDLLFLNYPFRCFLVSFHLTQ